MSAIGRLRAERESFVVSVSKLSSQSIEEMTNRIHSPIPILRIFDEAKALSFYVEWLNFKIDWQHRFDKNLPLYLQISRESCILHLSEHHEDACPGSALRIPVADVDELHRELKGRTYMGYFPEVQATSWGSRDMSILDPFGNRIVFTTDAESN